MRVLLALLALVAFAFPAVAEWRQCNSPTHYIQPTHSLYPGSIIFVNTATGVGPAEDEWKTVDLATALKEGHRLPTTVDAVFLTGLLIITHGAASEICDLTVTFRANGEASWLTSADYLWQTTEAQVGGGQRSTMSTWVPVKNGKFDWIWKKSTTGSWPSSCSYAINLVAQQAIACNDP